jgi:hypothetical protein
MEKNRIMEENRSRLERPKPMKIANEVIDSPASVNVALTEWKKYSSLAFPEEYDLKYSLPLANPNNTKERT